jgi:hypothetical protein
MVCIRPPFLILTLFFVFLDSDLLLEADLYRKTLNKPMLTPRGHSRTLSNISGESGEVEIELHHVPTLGAVYSTDDSNQSYPSVVAAVAAAAAAAESMDPLASTSSSPTKKLTKWEQVQATTSSTAKSMMSSTSAKFPTLNAISGIWKCPTLGGFHGVFRKMHNAAMQSTTRVTKQTKEAIDMSRESTYAVVTFTSRQGAVAARHCLADGRATDRWVTEDEIPIPPLADAAACHMCMCRNCCGPVTLTIDNRDKNWRHYGYVTLRYVRLLLLLLLVRNMMETRPIFAFDFLHSF